jgi:hypothetical protein
MSQDEPKPQPPLSPPEARQSETTVEKDQTFQKTSNRVQAVLKAQSIKALRGTIRVLEGVVVKLEVEPPPAATTGETPSFLDKVQRGWSGALAKIRSLLPENLNQKLSDTALTGIVAGIAVIAVWITSALLPGKPPEVATVPTEPVPAVNITTPPELTAPAAPQPIEVAPAAPQPIEVSPPPEPVPTPSPTLELTPEQNLIASIENQVAEITNQYANGLIQSIQANFGGSSLTIKVSDDWYNLKQPQQDNLAAQMLERSKELDFSHLEITDPQGTLLARSPVVGNDMVILRRQIIRVRSEERGVRSENLTAPLSSQSLSVDKF